MNSTERARLIRETIDKPNGKPSSPNSRAWISDGPFAKLVTEIATFAGSGTYRSCGHLYEWRVIQMTDPTKPIFHVRRIEPSGERVSVARLRLNESWSDWTNQSEPPRIFKKALAQVLRHRNQAIAAKAKPSPFTLTDQERENILESVGAAASAAIRSMDRVRSRGHEVVRRAHQHAPARSPLQGGPGRDVPR